LNALIPLSDPLETCAGSDRMAGRGRKL